MKHSIALFPAQGIGDAVLMNVLALFAQEGGYHVCVYHPQHKALASLFPELELCLPPSLESLDTAIAPFNIVFVQNDHSQFAYIMDQRRLKHLSITFIHPKHSKLEKPGDIVFYKKYPFVTNLINLGLLMFPHITLPSTKLLSRFDPATLRSNKKLIGIHPTSKDPFRNWPAQKYIELKNRLQSLGFSPYFIIEKKEHPLWKQYKLNPDELPEFNSLHDIANMLHQSNYFIGNDSGIGHIASMVGLPTLTISNSYKRVRMWRPDFTTNLIITPRLPLPNWKTLHFRLRDKKWHHFVSVNAVLKKFNALLELAP